MRFHFMTGWIVSGNDDTNLVEVTQAQLPMLTLHCNLTQQSTSIKA
jgi:hypothetical protein